VSDHTFHRVRTPDGSGVTVRQVGREIRLSVGSSQRMRCNATEATALLVALANALDIDVTTLPDWAATAEIKVSDR
jgi:cysteine sulfinate desulfinase/cysteine desulfurase-like protein